MSNKMEELRKINAQKKELLEQQRQLRQELNETKEERKAARSTMANSRKVVREHKTELRNNMAVIFDKFTTGTSEEIKDLAEDIMENSTKLVEALKDFAESKEEMDDL